MNATVDVDVVVVAFRSARHLRGCVEPLSGATGVRVIVVDNACPDRSCDTVRDLPVTIVEAGRNGGFAAGVNVGIAAGTAPAVLLLNPDARIAPDGVRRLAAVLADRRASIVAPHITGPEGDLHWSIRRFPRVRSTFAQAVGLHRVLPRASWVDEVVRDRAAYAVGHATSNGHPAPRCSCAGRCSRSSAVWTRASSCTARTRTSVGARGRADMTRGSSRR